MWRRWNEIDRMFNAMDLLQSRMNRIFPEFELPRTHPAAWSGGDGWPRTNLYDAGDHFEIRAEVPGLAKEDLNIRLQGNYLEISGARKSDVPENYLAHRVERGAASFSRSFTLPDDVDSERVEATLQDGILILKLAKAEAAKPKRITIN